MINHFVNLALKNNAFILHKHFPYDATFISEGLSLTLPQRTVLTNEFTN